MLEIYDVTHRTTSQLGVTKALATNMVWYDACWNSLLIPEVKQ